MRTLKTFALASAATLIATAAQAAPTTWAYSAKTGVGASYEAYVDGAYKAGGKTGAVSKVWFSIADGVLTETMYGLIHEAQIKQMRVAVETASGLAIEGADTTSKTEYLHVDAAGRPLSPAYKITTTDRQGRFVIEKRIFTDPDRNALFVRVTVTALKGAVTPTLLLEPHMANTGGGDVGAASASALTAHEGKAFLSLKASKPFAKASASVLKDGDALAALKATTTSAKGAIVLAGELPKVAKSETFDVVIGFGADAKAADRTAAATLKTGYAEVLARYNGEGAHVGWEDYLASLNELPRLRDASEDGGKLLQASALMLKVQEDRTYAGALIASLSNPWGDTVDATKSSTGYKAVWPRDFYQCAMALAALGDKETPLAAFHYLPTVQVGPKTPGNKGDGGWFLQKSHVDGTPEWVGVQLDQTAMPIMLGWKLWTWGWLPDAELKAFYGKMLKPAADFLVKGGKVNLDWNTATITPPFTQQERWEEQGGHSPSTTAAVIAGLVVAGDIAEAAGDAGSAELYRKTADDCAGKLEARMVTTKGTFGDGHYYLRLNSDQDPNNKSPVEARNGQAPVAEDKMLDAGFLELVRYGVRRADDPAILASLPEIDDEALEDLYRVRYSFTFPGVEGSFPGWRRYGVDGYGEDTKTGANYGADNQMRPGQRGRVWPIFTGERGHYELAVAGLSGKPDPTAVQKIRDTYVKAMELFANEGLMIPEQVWDGVGTDSAHGYVRGEGTDSATPLAWSHAEYVKLLRSVSDGQVWDHYAPVKARYAR
ncbi:glucan 1,4-alpha-glucosidase [Caulobacter vibrioides]|uniref:Glucoamylase n=3 Tax=Caulobacter vibrioides TaxID=155892 RepID=Q9A613_CAUVC|nr:glucan 1,4-alpha-glucosidase [Caulobacter vibrioides]YP_002517738.1 glucoamylase [Caulobacter vibrioides NA1000]AAK24253.1 glucoamylase [Caulobacter vibrioides CB15]ACL95830.1 glucoamylase [Caulobacter vibrioides NA1000]ATC29145.1 glucan 1,4-alpha-glucosidase [Caulobacter vibrioides]QXZ50656.1 glucan 1,4-alpha-glucosidase [Caulobacter vibrioides]BAO51876.1 glucoamylase [Caulobacter vibrioides CB15]